MQALAWPLSPSRDIADIAGAFLGRCRPGRGLAVRPGRRGWLRELGEFLAALGAVGALGEVFVVGALGEVFVVGALGEVFVVGGDPATPAGPFADSLAVLRSGVLQEAGVRRVGVAGYPEGHPSIAADALTEAMRAKVALLTEQGLDPAVITQFGFDVQPVLGWIRRLRCDGIEAQVRVGVPGPVGIKRLLAYARRFGIATSAGITRKYGFSLANLMGTTGPDAFVSALAEGFDPAVHGDVRLHFYTFGGITTTAAWVRDFTPADQSRDRPSGIRVRD